MTAEQFCYWLQGAFEILPDNMELDITQLQVVKDHLATVFTKVTPERKEQTYCSPVKDTPLEDAIKAGAVSPVGSLPAVLAVDEIDHIFNPQKDKPAGLPLQGSSPWPISAAIPRAWPSA